ncbi:MAG: hypothetical protein ACOY3Y_03645 [Acidobacteriota bacterium]
MLSRRDTRPDPLLTNIAQEYGTGGGYAYEELVPRRSVANYEFKYAIWDLGKYTSDETETLRAPGDTAKQDTDPSLTYVTGMCKAHAKKQKITDEDRATAPNPAALERAKIGRIVMSLRRAKELRFRDLVQDTGSVASTIPSVKWDAASGVTIEKNIDAAKEAFLLLCGFEATHILIPPLVAKVVKRDPTIRDLIKYTQDDLLVNGDLPPTVFGLRVVIPGAVRNTAVPGAAPALGRIWSADKVTLAYVNPAAATDPEAMTSIMEFGVDGFPGGLSYPVETWRDPDKSAKTDWYSVENVWTMERVAKCLYILDDVLT